MFLFRYKQIEFSLQGVKDYLKGPKFLQNIRPDELHKSLLEESKIDPDKEIQPFRDFQLNSPNLSILHFMKCALSLNGNIFPIQSNSASEANFSLKLSNWELLRRCGGFESVTLQNDSGNYGINYRINRARFRKIVWTSLALFLKSIFLWIPVSIQWKKAEKTLTSKQFWLEYWEKAR